MSRILRNREAIYQFVVDNLYGDYPKFQKECIVNLRDEEPKIIYSKGGFLFLEGKEFIQSLFVPKDMRKKGVGTELINFAKKRSKVLRVESFIDAIPFYEKNGFVVSGKSDRYKGMEYIPMEWKR